MNHLIPLITVFLMGLTAQAANNCRVDSISFFWDIEISSSPNVAEITDIANEGLEPEFETVLANKGYQVSDEQRKSARIYNNERDYYSAGRYLLISGLVEGSGEVSVLVDTNQYQASPMGIAKLIAKLNPLLVSLDQRILDGGDFTSTAQISEPGVVFIAGTRERFFGIGQTKAIAQALSQMPACQP